MNRSVFIAFAAIISLFFNACNDEGKSSKGVKSSASKLVFESPKSGNNFVWGDTIVFDIKLKAKEVKEAESISLYIGSDLVYEAKGDELHYAYLSNQGTGGQLRVKGVVKFKDGTTSRRRIGIKILADKGPTKMAYNLINTYPHDPTAFTQGLVYDSKENLLFESTGNYTESRLFKVKVGEEKFELEKSIPHEYFGEGITLMGDTLFQITYKRKLGFYYDREFNKLGEFTYPTEGWGLTNDGTHLIMSDGTANLYFINPHTFKIEKTLQVFSNKALIQSLNELEYVDGIIYANIYLTDIIAMIDAKSGKLLGLVNLEGILKNEYIKGRVDVLNGIAFNPELQTFYVTGKYWPKLFEVRFEEVVSGE